MLNDKYNFDISLNNKYAISIKGSIQPVHAIRCIKIKMPWYWNTSFRIICPHLKSRKTNIKMPKTHIKYTNQPLFKNKYDHIGRGQYFF